MRLKEPILIGAGGILLALFLYKPAKRVAMTPLAVHASWVEPLRESRLGRRSVLGMSDDKTAREYWGDEMVDDIERVNEQKRRLFATWQSGRGKMGLSCRFSTVEGDPIFVWVLVENGSARFIQDDMQDAWRSSAGVETLTAKAMRLGFYREGKFVEGEPGPRDSPIIVLELGTRGVFRKFFY